MDLQALIFSGTKKMCDQLAGSLNRSGVNCAAIHGDKDQSERDQALNGLKDGRIRVLVATDVAARGLDIKGARERQRQVFVADALPHFPEPCSRENP